MGKVYRKNSTSWVGILSIFRKNSAVWVEILNVYRKNSSAWVNVFAAAKIPGSASDPTITGTGKLFSTLTNNSLGTWTNSPTAYARQWMRSTGLTADNYVDIPGATSSTYTTVSADNGFYVICKVTATNSFGSNSAQSANKFVIRYAPVSLLIYTFSGSPTVGGTLTASQQIGSWKDTTDNSGDTSPETFEYEWSRADGTIVQSPAFNSINSTSYTISSGDLNQSIRFRATATNTGGSATSSYTTSSTVTQQYSFTFGNTLYIGSNGYITLDQAPSSAIAALPAGNGRTINIWNEDLVQYRLQEYSDSNNYYLYFKSYRYQSPLVQSAVNAVDYQIKFYTGQPYCDIYLERKGSSVPYNINDPGYWSNGLATGHAGVVGPYFWGAGSYLRVYFNGTPATTSGITWTSPSNSLWKDITTAQIDDSYTSHVTGPNRQAAVLSAPTNASVTPGPQGGTVSVNFTPNGSPYYQIYWYGTATAPSGAVTPDGENYTSPVIDATGPTLTATYYMYIRSVSSSGETSVGPSSLASAWSSVGSFNMTSTAVSQNTAPTARATSTNSSSTVKYLDSITWTAGSYTNAQSVTSVLVYSTNTSYLTSPNGDTSTATRSSNPYVLNANDPQGTPYVFAVRDIVVGTNGTTYYFYSNQITSALADAVGFSYATATSQVGGWTASISGASQSGAGYTFVSATAGSGTVNSSSGNVTASGLSSAQSSTITITKSVTGYNNINATASGNAATVTTYTLTYSANGGSTTPSSQSGTNGQTITLASGAGTRSGYTFGGWSIGGTTYSGGGSYTFGSANAAAAAIWDVVFVTPTCIAPSLQFLRTSGSSRLDWYCDYPTPSGSYSSIVGMDFEIRTTAGGGTLLASGTRSYPGAGTYPYSAAGTIWAFRMGTQNGDISYSSSARYGRARVRMLGTNGTQYVGTYSAWI